MVPVIYLSKKFLITYLSELSWYLPDLKPDKDASYVFSWIQEEIKKRDSDRKNRNEWTSAACWLETYFYRRGLEDQDPLHLSECRLFFQWTNTVTKTKREELFYNEFTKSVTQKEGGSRHKSLTRKMFL